MLAMQEKSPYLTPVNTVLVLANVAVYFILEAMGDTTDALFMYAHGAMYPAAVLAGGQYYRLFTSAFVHFGLSHLINNMVLLICLGSYVEKAYGRICYVILYLGRRPGEQPDFHVFYGIFRGYGSLGRSFRGGVRHDRRPAVPDYQDKGRFEDLPWKRFLLMIVLALYFGFATAGVDNAAHIGGLATGFAAGAIVYLIKKAAGGLRR